MKAADIKLGEWYAIRPAFSPRDSDSRLRGRVVEVKRTIKHVYSGERWDFQGHPSERLRAIVEWDPGQNPMRDDRDPAGVELTKIDCEWDVHAPRAQAAEAAQAQAASDREALRTAMNEVARTIGGGYVIERYESRKLQLVITADDLPAVQDTLSRLLTAAAQPAMDQLR